MTSTKTINLALQGGGAHGAFTWGVLHALLEDERIGFDSISGASAGAMNAAVMASGLLKGRREAIHRLEEFWQRVSEAAPLGLFAASNALKKLTGRENSLGKGAYLGMEALSTFFSPYQNRSVANPLQPLVVDLVDFEGLKGKAALKLHVAATDVRKGRLKIFNNKELSVNALLASSCLPTLFRAVEIDGEPYWDGGFTANPPLYPLANSRVRDIVIVRINPFFEEGLPQTGPAITDRLNAICFNAPLLAELRGLSLFPNLFIHMVGDDALMARLPLESKFNPDWTFLLSLHDAGLARGREWIARSFNALGREGTANVQALLATD